MSLGVRLTLLNGLVLLVALGSFASVSYVAQARALESSLDASLREQAGRLREIPAFGPNRGFRPSPPPLRGGRDGGLSEGPGQPPLIIPRSLSLGVASAAIPPDVVIQVTDRDGAVVARSRTLDSDDDMPTGPEMLERALSGEEWFVDGDLGGEPVRVFVAPFGAQLPWANGKPVGMIQIARPLAPVQGSLRTLQTTFLSVGAASVLASLLVGWLLARAALRPIDWLAVTAQAIGGAQDFGKRVPVRPSGRRDEVGRLANEFNRMLARLQGAYEQSEAALHAQRRFIADASHEMRTPLTSLRGNVDLLGRMAPVDGEAEDTDERAQLVADMTTETERMGRLVNDLLLLAQADAGQHLALAPVDVSVVVQDAFRAARFLREGVTLELGDLPADTWVAGNSDRLTQLVLILLDNALKFTPAGGRVTLDAAVSERQGIDGVAIRVVDTGPGIPLVDQPRVFERFYRGFPPSSLGGAGLGLAIARWISEEHAGTIDLESPPGLGTTFTVWLPTIVAPTGRTDSFTKISSARQVVPV